MVVTDRPGIMRIRVGQVAAKGRGGQSRRDRDREGRVGADDGEIIIYCRRTGDVLAEVRRYGDIKYDVTL